MKMSQLDVHRFEVTCEMHGEARAAPALDKPSGARLRFVAVCATVAALMLGHASLASADQAPRPTASPETGPVVVRAIASDGQAARPAPAHRPSGCATGHDCVECVAGCERGARRVVAELPRRGPVSSWRLSQPMPSRDPVSLIACYRGGCSGHGSGPLTPSLDIHVTVHKYRQGW